MATASLDPTVLNGSTRFAPTHRRTHSRSPSRSPTRKAQFAARELDPLLKNLSPDSTLQALQKTDTITTKEAEQNALARSISDASTSEREIGVRAALAAKKLREWQKEVSAWSWPSARDITWGAGFIPPAQSGSLNYYGSLPEASLNHYDERLEEIWDAIETLGLDEIKDYVFSSHVSPTPSERAMQRPSSPTGYGRMRDFTALITATVIQALPDLAHLYVLLETWSVRLNVCREIPELLKTIEASKAGVQIASEIIRSPQTGPLVTGEELETTQTILDGNVAALGKRVDNLLDQLEGQQDVLPQAWIDAVEDLERRYADWVVEAKQLVLRNEAASASNSHVPGTLPAAAPASLPVEKNAASQAEPVDTTSPSSRNAAVTAPIKRKALQPIETNKDRGHTRGVSEVSVADSILSGYSGDNADIVEAKPASLLPSPKVSVIDPFSGKTAESWLTAPPAAGTSPKRPFLLQRASTASIEVVPKASIKEVNLRRTGSHDMLREMRESPPGTPRRTLKKLTGMETPQTSPLREQNALTVEDSNHLPTTPGASAPMLADETAVLDHDEPADVNLVMPPLPRRSSKRLSYTISHPSRPTTPADKLNVEHAVAEDNSSGKVVRQPVTPPTKIRTNETLHDKIRGILTSLPTKIKMTEDSDSAESSNASESSTRENSPAPALKLSPVKDRSRHGNSTSAIRVYHLSRSGKGRDGAPIKLFVRAVGENGERVMVRVGGGWADLKEYLREYSLHHGGRGIDESKLEVANFPRKTRSQLLAGKVAEISARSVTPAELEGRVSSSNTGFDFGPLVDLSRTRTASPTPFDPDEYYGAPTVTREPKTYTMDAPTMTTRTSSEGDNQTNMRKPPEFDQTNRPQPQPLQDPDVPQTMTNNLVSGNVSTSTTMSTVPLPSPMYTPYTPLGAAGPVQSGRRTTPQTMTRFPPTQAAGQTNRPRAVSGQNVSVVHGPTTTTTTLVTSRVGGTPNKNRRIVSASATPPPLSTATTGRVTPTPLTALPTGRTTPMQTTSRAASTPLTALPAGGATPIQSPLGSLTSNTSKISQRPPANVSRSSTPDSAKGIKSKMNLSDVSGIKRVFLRRKNSK